MTGFTFYGCVEGARAPVSVDYASLGNSHLRAIKHCQPFRDGSAYGWHLHAPINCHIKWDGTAFWWLPEGRGKWVECGTVTGRMIARASGVHDRAADDPLMRIPIVSAAPEPGIVQIWTGLVATTPPNWSLLVRGIPNKPLSQQYEVLDGIIETDWWHGPLLGVLRFRKTDAPVELSTETPLFAAQPVLRDAYLPGMADQAVFLPATPPHLERARQLAVDVSAMRQDSSPGVYRRSALRKRRNSPGGASPA